MLSKKCPSCQRSTGWLGPKKAKADPDAKWADYPWLFECRHCGAPLRRRNYHLSAISATILIAWSVLGAWEVWPWISKSLGWPKSSVTLATAAVLLIVFGLFQRHMGYELVEDAPGHGEPDVQG